MCYSNSATLHEILMLLLEGKVAVFFNFGIYAEEAAFYLGLCTTSGQIRGSGAFIWSEFHIFCARHLYSDGDILRHCCELLLGVLPNAPPGGNSDDSSWSAVHGRCQHIAHYL